MNEVERRHWAQDMARNSRRRAKERGLEHTITWRDIEIPDDCPIALKPFHPKGRQLHPLSPTLDRKDPTKGYIPGNLQVICWMANKAKSELTLDMLKRLVANLEN